ncbi:MAG: hypothetical protein IKO85_03295 [Bacteroidaceae bacterium]|nr:hypothetical protein [Bacteroidaceae bacterium]
MKLVRKPWIWVSRFRNRKGYGVHSPFAYSFIRGVVLETTPYYAYSELAQLHPWWVRWGRMYPLSCRQLLFRLANFAEPKTVVLLTEDEVAKKYVRAAVPRAEIISAGKPLSTNTGRGKGDTKRERKMVEMKAEFVFIGREYLGEAARYAVAMPPQGMMVCEGIHENREAMEIWRAIQADPHTGITFDLYTYGVAFFNHALYKQHYKVNF